MTEPKPTAPSEKGSAIASVLEHLHRLLRKELALVKAEMSQKLNRAAVAIGLITISVIAAIIGLNVAAAAAVAALVAMGMAGGWAALLVAGVCILIAVIVYVRGVRMLKSITLFPTETVAELKSDINTLKESFHDE